MRLSNCFRAAGLALCASLSMTAHAVIIDDENWQPIWAASSLTPGGDPASHYARAVGRVEECSGALISETVFLSAAHCDIFQGADNVVEFYHFIDAEYYVRDRLVDLGVSPATLSKMSNQEVREFFLTWNCVSKSQFGGHSIDSRDARWYKCERKYFDGIGVFGPGRILGYINVGDARQVAAGDPIRVPSVNTPSFGELSSLMAFGVIEAEDAPCVLATVKHCMRHTADTLKGSSGAPILSDATLNLVGVHSGGSLDAPWNGNIMQEVKEWHFEFLREQEQIQRDNLAEWVRSVEFGWPTLTSQLTPPVGDPVGTIQFEICPQGQLAAGVIGTTSADGNVGNLGLICKPETVLSGFYPQVQLLTVAVPGGDATTNFVSGTFPFNTYLNEALDQTKAIFTYQQQSFALCPSDYFLVGMSLQPGVTGLGKVSSILCASLYGDSMVSRTLRRNIGYNGPARPIRAKWCGYYSHQRRRGVKGLVLRVTDRTEQAQLVCY